jgi:uncharacterized protein (DUF169 family)
MVWQDYSRELKGLLGLAGEPVAVTYTNDEIPGKRLQIWVCDALKGADRGKSYVIEAENSACPGGTWHCGFKPPPSGGAQRWLQWFLTRGEKLTHSIVTFERMVKLTQPPPTGLAERMLIGPAVETEVRPDLFVFLCNPTQACRLVTLDQYWDGIPSRWESAGSLCHMAIAYSLVTGRSNLTLGDYTARKAKGFADDVVFVTIPYERMASLVAAIPECTAGTAEFTPPPERPSS